MALNRREVLTTGIAVLGATQVLAAAPVIAAAGSSNKALIDAAELCAKVGRDCLEMCLKTLSTGDKMMAECAATVRQMIPLCNAVAELARFNGSQLKAVAAACAKACRECETSCNKHAVHHEECKACAASCKACAAECDKLA